MIALDGTIIGLTLFRPPLILKMHVFLRQLMQIANDW